MAFIQIKRIPTPAKILEEMPLPEKLLRMKLQRDRLIKSIFSGESRKFLVIIGPCSADNSQAVCQYTARLSELQKKVKKNLVIIPRIYTNKPRTTGQGYKGMVHQPDPNDKPNISEGIRSIRMLHLRSLEESGLSAADEMLYPGNYPYLEDLLSYVAIGARSVENQQHRLTVSGLDIPVGMKNPTSGDLSVMLNSVQAAQAAHTFIYNGWEVKTTGNRLAHSILRGALNQYGQSIPNYHYENMIRLASMYDSRSLRNPAIIVDTNHANSDRQFHEQPRIAREVFLSMNNSKVLRKMVKGLMIESYLKEGAQDPSGKVFGRSITDPCLGWDQSRELVMEISELMKGK